MRWRYWLFGVILVFVLLGCYGLWIGSSIVVIVFTGAGMVISIAQAFFPFPLGRFPSENKIKSELILPSSSILTKKTQKLNILYRVIEVVLHPILPKIESKVGLILPESYIKKQQRKRSEAIKRYAFSACLFSLNLVVPLFIIFPSYLYTVTAPQGLCTILTKEIVGGVEPIGSDTGVAIPYYDLQFTFRLRTNDGQTHPSIIGSTSINPHPNGVYLDSQEAQQQLNRYLIGKTYTCRYHLLFNLDLSAWLISDKPLPSRDKQKG